MCSAYRLCGQVTTTCICGSDLHLYQNMVPGMQVCEVMLSSDNKKSLSCSINCKFNLLRACMSLQPGDIMAMRCARALMCSDKHFLEMFSNSAELITLNFYHGHPCSYSSWALSLKSAPT